jgi:hypothetical protein
VYRRGNSACVRLKQFHFRKLEYNLSSISFFFGFYALIVIYMAFSNNVKVQWGKLNILCEERANEKFRLRAIGGSKILSDFISVFKHKS